MRILIRCACAIVLAALVWPEIDAYCGEWLLADAGARLSDAFKGTTRGDASVNSVQGALAEAQLAASRLPGDQRPALSASIALLLLHRGAEAAAILDAAITAGERPELTLNLGRARGILGDENGAQAAFLRTAQPVRPADSDAARALREPLLDRVKILRKTICAQGVCGRSRRCNSRFSLCADAAARSHSCSSAANPTRPHVLTLLDQARALCASCSASAGSASTRATASATAPASSATSRSRPATASRPAAAMLDATTACPLPSPRES